MPALARGLGTDLNTLLSFKNEPTREEIGDFLNKLAEDAAKMGRNMHLEWEWIRCANILPVIY